MAVARRHMATSSSDTGQRPSVGSAHIRLALFIQRLATSCGLKSPDMAVAARSPVDLETVTWPLPAPPHPDPLLTPNRMQVDQSVSCQPRIPPGPVAPDQAIYSITKV
jgi:hypothetical protein